MCVLVLFDFIVNLCVRACVWSLALLCSNFLCINLFPLTHFFCTHAEEKDVRVQQSLTAKIAEYSKRVLAIEASLSSSNSNSNSNSNNTHTFTPATNTPSRVSPAGRERKHSIADTAPPPSMAQRALGVTRERGRERKLSAANAGEAKYAYTLSAVRPPANIQMNTLIRWRCIYIHDLSYLAESLAQNEYGNIESNTTI